MTLHEVKVLQCRQYEVEKVEGMQILLVKCTLRITNKKTHNAESSPFNV